MLSAFTARPIIEIKQSEKSKIETILAHGDRILVGLNNGALRVYRINELQPPSSPPSKPNGSSAEDKTHHADDGQDEGLPSRGQKQPQQSKSKKPADLMREMEKFSPRAIEQLAIIREANVLVSLSNYHISLHELHTYEPIETLTRTKNASCFAVTSNIVNDPSTGVPEIISRLAVAVRRRLLLWSWHECELSDEVGEVTLSESIRTITWASATKVVCGLNAGYVMVDVLSHEVEDILSPGTSASGGQPVRFGATGSAGMGYMGLGGYAPKPLAAKLAEDEMLLAKDINTLFITNAGKAIDKRQIPWQSAPESIGFSYPYILALQPPSKGSMDVRNPDTLSLLQTITLPGAAQIHFPPPNVSLAHAGKGFYVCSERSVWKMGATDYDAQIEELVESGQFDEAVSVLGMLEDALLRNKQETLREVKMLKAEALFQHGKYRDSMYLFAEEDVQAPPERVLKLYPPFIAGELSGWSAEEAHEEKTEEGDGPQQTNGDQETSDEPGTESSSPVKGTGRFANLFTGSRKQQPDAASITSKKQGTDTDEATSVKGKPADDRPLEGKELSDAVHALTGYLVGTRTRLQRVINPATGKLRRTDANGSFDEALKSLMSASHADKDANESDDQLEPELQRVSKLVDTALFRAYMFWRPSLAGPLFRLPNFCDPDVVNEKLLEHDRYTELIDFFYGKKLHAQALDLLRRFGDTSEPDPAAPALHGPGRTVAYLQSLPSSEVDTVLKHSEWTLRADPGPAMEVFVADSENAEALPRERVAAFLKGLDSDLELQYLEHVINELDDSTPEFHNRLVELYITHLKERERDTKWEQEMERFVSFLRDVKGQYSLSKALGQIPREDSAFYDAHAIVLSNMGSHKQALEIYVFKMMDYAKAEEYCNRIHRSDDPRSPSPSQPRRKQASPSASDEAEEAPPSIYHTLLSLYLTPPSPHKQALGPALDLLSKHGSRLPAASTLSLIPDEIPVRELESYFRGRIRSTNSVVNEARVVAGLRATEYISSQALLSLGDGVPGGQGGRNRRVVVTDERVCGACHKRLGGSVVSALPDNSVVHYGCLGRGEKGEQQQQQQHRAGSWGRRRS